MEAGVTANSVHSRGGLMECGALVRAWIPMQEASAHGENLLAGKNRVLERVPWSCLDCSKVHPIPCVFIHQPGIGGDGAPLSWGGSSSLRTQMCYVSKSLRIQVHVGQLAMDPGCPVLLDLQAAIQRHCRPMLSARNYLNPDNYQSITYL